MDKENLIKEIKDQLTGLAIMAKCNKLTLEQAIMFYDLQFRLKCKLHELEKEG